MKKSYVKRYVISSYLLLWTLIIVLCGSATKIFHAPIVVMWILRNVCAWSPTLLLLIFWEKFRPDEKRMTFIKRCFSGKIKLPLLIIPCLVVSGVSVLSLLIVSGVEGKSIASFFELGTTPLGLSIFLSFTSGPTGEELGWRGYVREELNEKYSFLRSSIYQGLIWCFWHTLLWVVDSQFLDWRAIPYILSNIIGITAITIIMNIVLEKQNNLIYSILIHFSFNVIYVFLRADDIWFFITLTIIYLLISPLAIFIRNKSVEKSNLCPATKNMVK